MEDQGTGPTGTHDSGTCSYCGRRDLTVTVTFDKHDPVSILRALREVIDSETLRIVAQAEIAR